MQEWKDCDLCIQSYLDCTATIENTCKDVSKARRKAIKELAENNLFNTLHIDSAVVDLTFPIGAFVSFIGYWSVPNNFPYLLDKNYITVDMTNGEEFSTHVFPARYLLMSTKEVEEAELQVFAEMRKYRIEKTKEEELQAQAKQEEYNHKQFLLQEERDLAEYKRLKEKFKE